MNSTKKIPFAEIIPKYKNFFFDCGGVFYNGPNDLPEAYKALIKLKEQNKNVFIITNASRVTRQDMYDKMSKNGFEPDMDKIYTSSYLTAQYLKLNYPDVKKVYVVGTKALVTELELAGIQTLGSHDDSNKPMNMNLFDDLKVDEDIKGVVAGIDFEFNYYKICYASILVQKGAVFIATNDDINMKMKHFKMPGAACMVKSIELASEKKPYVIGKPNPEIIEIACKSFGFKKEECLMVGDNLATDVMLGKNAGIDTFVVLSGLTTEENLKEEAAKPDGILPNYYWNQLEP